MEELNIRNFRLINGDSVLALVSSNNDDNYLVEKPVAIQPTVIGGYKFSPWFPFTDQKMFTINKDNIVGESNVATEIKEEYIKYVLEKVTFTPPKCNEDIMETLVHQVAEQLDLTDIEIEDELELLQISTDDDTIH